MHVLKSSIITVRSVTDVARMLQVLDCSACCGGSIYIYIYIYILAVIIFFTALKNCYSDPLSNVEVGCDHGVLGQTALCQLFT